MERRYLLKAGLLGLGVAAANPGQTATADCAPVSSPDPTPLDRELEKYPRCTHCGMDRRKFHRSRCLVHYQDDLADGTCSIHCLAVSLVKNLGKETRGLYVADFGATEEPRPLTNALEATFIVGGEFPRVMSKRPKTAFSSRETALTAQALGGGELASYDQALLAAYTDLAEALKTRRERRNKEKAAS